MNDPQPPPGLIERLNRIADANPPPPSIGSLEKQRQVLRRRFTRLRNEATAVYQQLQKLDRLIGDADGGER